MARKRIADGPGKRKARIMIRDDARETSTALNGARSNVVLRERGYMEAMARRGRAGQI